uniref:Uncharacterized protein n=1 Tax=Arundo donax TaxID=35708 RepID=A0A0A9DNL6_ARUDO
MGGDTISREVVLSLVECIFCTTYTCCLSCLHLHLHYLFIFTVSFEGEMLLLLILWTIII